jgi:hypothetical protein
MDKILYIHIGMGKTGTTSLQHFFWNNRNQLAKDGVLYPEIGFEPSVRAHHVFGHLWGGVDWKTNLQVDSHDKDRILTELQTLFATTNKSVLISTEALLQVLVNIHQPFFHDIDTYFDKSKIKIIVYLRRQDLHIQSAYKEAVKKALRASSIRVNPVADYYSWVSRLVDFFGKENVIVQPFERGQFINNSIFETFLSHLEIPYSSQYQPLSEHKNQSMCSKALALCQLTNQYSGFENAHLGRRLNAQIMEILHDNEKYALFSGAETLSILEQCKESNGRVAREYLDREDGILFYDPQPTNSKTEKFPIEISIEEIVETFSKIWLKQQETIQKQQIKTGAPDTGNCDFMECSKASENLGLRSLCMSFVDTILGWYKKLFMKRDKDLL